MPSTASKQGVFYTMVTQKYAIKSHLTSSRNHSTIVKTVKIQLDGLVTRH